MKNAVLFFCALAFCLLVSPLHAQTGSEICLDEAKAAFTGTTPTQLNAGGQPVALVYQHDYIMKTDPKKEQLSAKETRIYSGAVVYWDGPDDEVVMDGSERIHFRKAQYTIYRLKPDAAVAAWVPGVDPGIFDHCLARRCDYVDAPDLDSISYKRVFMTVEGKGQGQYGVQDMEIIFNPLDGSLISIEVNYTGKSQQSWARYTILSRDPAAAEAVPGSPASWFLTGDGSPNDSYAGNKVLDYR